MSQLTVIEDSPQGRYKKYNECLGSGSYKKVYRGFDTVHGRDVAWNEIFVQGLPQKEKERFASEVELLRFLHNEHFIEYYSSWYDAKQDKIVLITQIVIGGTLNNYVKNKQLNMEVIKKWSVQILEALDYLHTRDPPIIHRDLKCSNIFIDGKTSKILIGDLGLSKRRRDEQMSIAGTPEFMAPEIFANGVYDEKVDIYAFGMCILELITQQVPYSECKSIRDIYNKVTSGILPECLDDVKDEEAKVFIKKLIGKAPARPSAGELLHDPFLTTFRPCDRDVIVIDKKREMDSEIIQPDWEDAAELANSASTIVEEISEESDGGSETNKYNSVPSLVVEDNKKDQPVLETPPTSPRLIISHKRPSSLTLGVDVSVNSIYKAHIIHNRNMSSLSAQKGGFGSGNLSPPMGAVQSPGRSHTHTASLENMDIQPFGLKQATMDDSEKSETTVNTQQDCILKLVIVFDDETNEEIEKEGDEKIIDSLTIGLVKQDNNEFTFRVSCSYYKDGNKEKKEISTQSCHYSYGKDTPEGLVSKLVSNGVIKECVLDALADVVDGWITNYLMTEINKLEPTEEDVDNEILEKDT